MTKIGIINLTDNWKALLNQIGVKYSNISSNDKLYDYSLVIINTNDIAAYNNQLQRFIDNGGAILDCSGSFIKNRNYKTRLIHKEFLILENFLFNGIVDLNNKITEIYLKETNSWNYFSIEKSGDSILAFLGLPIDTLLSNENSKRIKFLSNRKRHPEEDVNTVSKGAVSKIVFNLLKELHIKRDLPFIHKWFFPKKEQSIFLFREDTDYCKEIDVVKIQDIAALNNIKVTWFIHTKSNLKFLQKYKVFNKDELALHCFDHFTSNKSKYIQKDLKKGNELLNKINVIPKGYAAPYGIWSRTLSHELKALDFNYSSEFSLIYNSLPFRSELTDNIIQIPIHPICIDSLLKTGKSDIEVIKYYTNEIDYCISNLLPIALYDHPGHDHYNILDSIFKYINSLKINTYTFSEYASWWDKREKSNSIIKLLPNYNIEVETENDVTVCLWKNRNDYLLLDKKGSYNIKSFDTITLPDNCITNKDDLKTIRKKDINMIKRSLLAKYLWRNKK